MVTSNGKGGGGKGEGEEKWRECDADCGAWQSGGNSGGEMRKWTVEHEGEAEKGWGAGEC